MKRKYLLQLALLGLAGQMAFAQVTVTIPGAPEDNGLKPKSGTVFLHTDGSIFNNSLEGSQGVAIANNGNILVGWEDDGNDITDFEAVWTMLGPDGSMITPVTTIDSTNVVGGPIQTRFLAYFRSDGSPISGWTSWGPKIKANLFGDGVGMGGTSFDLGTEDSDFADIQPGGDFPSVQLLSNTGQPVRILQGVPTDYGLRPGNIRIGDWDYLSNGNVLIVGESRQNADLVDVYGGVSGNTHAIYRILSPTGTEVKSESLVSETPEKAEIWHGSAVTANGFAIRFALNGVAKMRLFSNDGTAVSTNIDLATLCGKPMFAGGGRGEGVGFGGNGKDAYVYAVSGVDTDGTHQVAVAVINANGTLRWMKTVTEPELVLNTSDRVHAAIDEKGRVFVVFTDNAQSFAQGGSATGVMGRLFDATGAPMGGTFYISEVENPAFLPDEARRPRVAWRNNLAAVSWESRNNNVASWDVNGDGRNDLTMAVRVFSTFTPGTVEGAGLTRIVGDTPVIVPAQNSLDNWEPYAGVLGTTDFLIEGNTFADGSTANQRFVVMVQPATGGAGKLAEGFYADDGTPYKGQINLSRQNGNPGRVAGDKRPGAVNYIVGAEISAHGFPEFQNPAGRWSSNAVFSGANRWAGVQTYSLNTTTLNPTPLTKAYDPILGVQTGDYIGNVGEVSRFGGDVQALDNGNFVVVTDDRSGYFGLTRSPVYAIIKPTGEIVKAGTPVDPTVTNDQIWANVVGIKGGFAIRFQGKIRFFDNAGNLRGSIDQNASGETSFDRGRGDGTRIAGHINSPFVFLAGGTTPVGGKNTGVKVAAFDSRDFSFAAITQVAEPSFPAGTSGYDRVHIASDALNRMVVAYESVPTGFDVGKVQSVTRVLSFDGTAKTFTPLTTSFYPFLNSVPGTDGALSQIRAFRPSVAMTTKQILVSAKGEINLQNKPDLGPNSPTQLNFFTVFSHPNPQDDPTPSVSGGITLAAAKTGNNVTFSWTADGVALYSTTSLPGTTWTKITTANKTYTLTSPTGSLFFRLGPP